MMASVALAPSRVVAPRVRTSSSAIARASAEPDGSSSAPPPPPMKVAVTGAGGRTGSIVMKLLASDASGAFAPPRGLVRSTKSGDKVRNLCDGGDANLCDVVEGDISSADALRTLCDGVDALVMLTSAVPKPKIGSMIAALVSKILPWAENKRPDFYFPEGGSPREVDYEWQVAQIDAAKRAGVKKVVLVSSMGGTQIDNFLNTMGGGGDVGDANILLWKRKAEMALVASGLDYSIVHPGGLLNKEGGKRELLVGVNDELLAGDRRSVPRADVARCVVACLTSPSAKNLSFDLASREEGEGGGATTDVDALLEAASGMTYDYSLPKNSPVPLP